MAHWTEICKNKYILLLELIKMLCLVGHAELVVILCVFVALEDIFNITLPIRSFILKNALRKYIFLVGSMYNFSIVGFNDHCSL